MKIPKIDTLEFEDLCCADLFIFKREFFMVIDQLDQDKFNAIRLSDGVLMKFKEDTKVVFVNGKITIE